MGAHLGSNVSQTAQEKEIQKWIRDLELSETDKLILEFAPRAIVHGLQVVGLSAGQQYTILEIILDKFGRDMRPWGRKYLEEQVYALGNLLQLENCQRSHGDVDKTKKEVIED